MRHVRLSTSAVVPSSRLARPLSFGVVAAVVLAVSPVLPTVAAQAVPGAAPSPLLRAVTLPSEAPAPLQPAADGELSGLRTRYSRTFLDAKRGLVRKAVLSQVPVNYPDASGRWQKIDDTLVADAGTAGGWHVAAEGYTADFPRSLASPYVLGSASKTMQVRITGAAGTASVSGNTVTYTDALPGLTVAYTAGPTGVRETITYATAAAVRPLTYSAELPQGTTTATDGTGGEQLALGGTQDARWTLPAGWVAEAGSPVHDRDALSTTFSGHPRGAAPSQTWTEQVAPSWADATNRKFPLTVDPDYQVNYNIGTSQTCTLVAGTPSVSACSGTQSIGNAGDGLGAHRALVQFNVSPIPAGSTVLESDAYLGSSTLSGTSTAPQITATANCTAFNTTASWSSSGTGPSWTGGNPCNGILFTGASQSSFYITSAVQAWVDGLTPNTGLILQNQNESTTGLTSFTSPSAEVYYVPRVGTSPFTQYTNYPLTGHASAGVDVTSGNLLVDTSDLTVASKGLPFTFEHDYNSLAAALGAGSGPIGQDSLGVGWTSNLGDTQGFGVGCACESTLFHDPTLHGAYIGLTATTNYTGTPGLQPMAGRNLTLSSDTSGINYTDSSSGLTYTNGGTQISDAHNNTLKATIGYVNSRYTLTSATDSENRSYTFSHNSDGFLTGATDSAGARSVSYAHDSSDQLTGFTDTRGKSYTYAYDPTSKLLTSVTTPGNRTIGFAYDTGNRVHTVTQTVTDCAHSSGAVETYTYNYIAPDASKPAGAMAETTVTDPLGHMTRYYLDARHAVIETLDANNHTQQSSYDPITGLTMQHTDGLSQVSTLQYQNRNLTSQSAPANTAGDSPARTTYGAYTTGAKPTPTMTTDAQGNVSTLQLDGASDVTEVDTNYPNNNTSNTALTKAKTSYNGDGTVATTTSPNGAVTTLGYSKTGDLTTITPPNGSGLGATTIGPDADSRTHTVTDGRGKTTTYTYDADDRITLVSYADNTSVTYGYDDDDNLTYRKDRDGQSSTFSYDTRNRPYQQVDRSGLTNTYCYNMDSSLASYADSAGTVTYGYTGDSAGNATTVTQPGGTCAGYTLYGTKALPVAGKACIVLHYDANNRVDEIGEPGSVDQKLTRDNSGDVTNITATAGTTPTTLENITYTYKQGTSERHLAYTRTDNLTGVTGTYGFTEQNQLSTAANQEIGSGTKQNYAYSYDADGNRTKTTTGTASTYAGFNSADELCWTTTTAQTSSACGPAPTGATTFGYDPAGDQTSSSAGYSASIDAAGDTTSSTSPTGTNSTSYTYSDANQALRLTAGNASFTNSIFGAATKTVSGTTTAYTNTPAGALLAQRLSTGGITYGIQDVNGSTLATVDANGALTGSRYYYDPYGTPTAGSGYDHTWQGLYQDATGQYKTGIRYLATGQGAFTQLDPTHQDPLQYGYAGDDPIDNSDASGTDFLDISVEGCFGICISAGVDIGDGGTHAHVGAGVGPDAGVSASATDNTGEAESGADADVSCTAGGAEVGADSSGGADAGVTTGTDVGCEAGGSYTF